MPHTSTDGRTYGQTLLDVGDSVTVPVEAWKLWNNTGVRVAPDQVYRLSATGEWRDWFVPCKADGYPTRNLMQLLFAPFRRVRSALWFQLIVAVDSGGEMEPAGLELDAWHPKAEGLLTCFANDVPFMYWNNSGLVWLTIERVE